MTNRESRSGLPTIDPVTRLRLYDRLVPRGVLGELFPTLRHAHKGGR
jgi:hypothetical protein